VKAAEPSGVALRAGGLRASLGKGIAHLDRCAVPSAPLAAELLLMHVLQRDRAWLYAHPEYELSSEQAAAYDDLIERRSAGVPTQYLTGHQEFWGLDFAVGPGVLIPRPETEHLVEVVLARVGARRSQSLRIADVGTGSGCIAIALACELPRAEIVATDISALALDYAQTNAARHGVSSRIQFYETNLLRAVAEFSDRARNSFDLIVSNPPYVGRNDAAKLAREVREHEPAEALFAGDRGFDLYPGLIEQATKLLCPEGMIVLEVGYDGADYVQSLLSASGWCAVEVSRDLAGIERVVSARLSI
jgi:release factor glutamine methyltransferase